MPFPIAPSPQSNESESDFSIQDPLRLRSAITPVFAFDLQTKSLRDPRTGRRIGLGTAFYVTPFGRQLSAMHVIADFLNHQKVDIKAGCRTEMNKDAKFAISILDDPGLRYGASPTKAIMLATNFVMIPVNHSNNPAAIIMSNTYLKHIEPSIDIASWDIGVPSEPKNIYLPLRVDCEASVRKGDRVMAIGYPKIESWRRPSAEMDTYQEEMRGSIGRVLDVTDLLDEERKIWPTLTVDVRWASGMSGGPVFNENGQVIGIVTSSSDCLEGASTWSRALWLEKLPYHPAIFGPIDPRNPGWVCGWGVCNAKSLIELFATQEAADAFLKRYGPGLTVRQVSAPYSPRLQGAMV